MMKRILIIVICSFCSLNFQAQTNLILNPNFEQCSQCPDAVGQINRCINWHNAGDSTNQTLSSPDYFNTCSPNAGYRPPYGGYGYQETHSGNAYALVNTWLPLHPLVREFIQGTLSQALSIGQTYYVSFYANLPFGFSNSIVSVATNHLGALFTTFPFVNQHYATIINFAHIYTDSLVTDTLNWTLISGSFIADSAYNYITIGNFFDALHTDTLHLGSSPNDVSAYYIDDVCVSTDSLFATNWWLTTGMQNEQIYSHQISIYPNPSSGEINISSYNPMQEIKIYDPLGELVFSSEIKGDLQSKLSLQFLNAGLYYVRVKTANEYYSTLINLIY